MKIYNLNLKYRYVYVDYSFTAACILSVHSFYVYTEDVAMLGSVVITVWMSVEW